MEDIVPKRLSSAEVAVAPVIETSLASASPQLNNDAQQMSITATPGSPIARALPPPRTFTAVNGDRASASASASAANSPRLTKTPGPELAAPSSPRRIVVSTPKTGEPNGHGSLTSAHQGKRMNGVENGDPESPLSELGSEARSPGETIDAELVEVSDQMPTVASDQVGDISMGDETANQTPYSKRKRPAIFDSLNENQLEGPGTLSEDLATPPTSARPSKAPRTSLAGSTAVIQDANKALSKGIVVGCWKGSPFAEFERRHAVVGFIDTADRLRTRLQQYDLLGQPIDVKPSGGSWVTFENVLFLEHLVGLNQIQVKEYVRLRPGIGEETEEGRRAAQKQAVQDAIENAKLQPTSGVGPPPSIAQGPGSSDGAQPPIVRITTQRRKSGKFAGEEISAIVADSPSRTRTVLPSPRTANAPIRLDLDPLPGTRPTRILLGTWKNSSGRDVGSRHAVYGIMGQNDSFRAKLMRETRDGRHVDGNFPPGTGGPWITVDDVDLEQHLKLLNREELKEYCRIRQYQIDHGEQWEDRVHNEMIAAQEAAKRVDNGVHQKRVPALISPVEELGVEGEEEEEEDVLDHDKEETLEVRQSRPHELPSRPSRRSLNNTVDTRASTRVVPDDSHERANALARREIARAEASQGRADRHALQRERVAAAASDTAIVAASGSFGDDAPLPSSRDRTPFHASDDMQRLNKVWAAQETLRLRGSGHVDAKICNGVKYERKTTGPFAGKLVSHGTIINIDGEDYVEYRVLTKPFFF